jgi:glutamine amidotransferase-like uncharacterized protein/N-formylglutamate amidohydrolase
MSLGLTATVSSKVANRVTSTMINGPFQSRISMQLNLFRLVAVCTLSVTALGLNHARAQSTQDLVSITRGELPIILTAPHGGREAITGVEEREGEGVKGFSARIDSFTSQLAGNLADSIEEKLGKRPYLVVARFHRKYLDANRPERLAYESEAAKAAYDTYHHAITDARLEIIQRWGHGILLDLHGQGAEPQVIFRGTQNGKTTEHLLKRFGRKAVAGQASLFGRLAEQGFRVYPAVDSTDGEHDRYDGGFTVVTYGSGGGGAFDAIQLELGRGLRIPDVNAVTADKIANAVVAFTKDYGSNVLSDDVADGDRKIRVGVYTDKGTGGSLKSVLNDLSEFQDASVTKLSADDIRLGQLSEIDVLIQPGGSGSGQGRHLGEDGRESIREFVRSGGGFIGICGGSYLASADYDWSLNILDAKVLDRKHWARGHGDVEIGMTEAGKKLLKTDEPQLTIQYWQGPLLAPANRPEIEDYETIATFETEIANNGAPKGVMLGTTAIAKGRFGKGRVVCFSPHPELTEGLEPLLKHAIDHVNRKRPKSQREEPTKLHPLEVGK